MELKVKFFSALSAKELHDIYRLRVSVFVVEQRCPYQEVDDADERAYRKSYREREYDDDEAQLVSFEVSS